jgi:AraC-like DNA-binding protein
MSRDEQCAGNGEGDSQAAAVLVATFPMSAGLTFDWHTHDDHQLAWAAAGVLIVRTGAATWTLPPSRALWIPAGLRHETLSAGRATMRSLYIRPELCPISWPDFTPVAASPLLAELIGYLADPGLDAERRQHAETMIVDLLQPVPMTAIEVKMPGDDRAQQVAQALVDDPADGRSLAQWGLVVGASERTLARAFIAGTGMSFGRWRTLLRVQSGISALAAGEPVGNVSRRVGYESPSAFVAAFRREIGMTPARYFGEPSPRPD